MALTAVLALGVALADSADSVVLETALDAVLGAEAVVLALRLDAGGGNV